MASNGNSSLAPGTARRPRCIAVVGPFQSGKTSLVSAIASRAAIGRGAPGNPDQRAPGMTTEPRLTTVDFLGDTTTFVDCPGSIEFLHDMRSVVPVCDAAIVVCETDERKLPALAVILRELEEADIPRFIFLNKIDAATCRVRETLALLQRASRTPLLLRQIPIWHDGIAVGFVDLALERAFIYREHAPSEVVALPQGELPREREARFAMLERLADYDDALMENLISEIEPPRDLVFEDLARELKQRHVVPVLIGAAERGNGVTRLLKALRHEVPDLADTRARLGLAESGPPLAQIIRTSNGGQGGRVSLARVLRGRFAEGDTVIGSGGAETRVGGLASSGAPQPARRPHVSEGEVARFVRLERVATGDCIAGGRNRPQALATVAPPEPVYRAALRVKDRRDDVRLTGALARLVEEDAAFVLDTRPDTGELCLGGQGEMHLRAAVDRLARRFGVETVTSAPKVAYRETIGVRAIARGRHRKQSGGHGQFGDVTIEVSPLGRGEGFRFEDRIVGGAIPRQYIASVEAGIVAALAAGPLGFPVSDIAVTLTDGSYHAVDSSDAAFQTAARLAMAEALTQARPVLLEPILSVEIVVPSEAVARAGALVSSRRGQILRYDSRPGWDGWDVIDAMIPDAELGDLIIELRSASAGVGTFRSTFDHMADLTGRPAEFVLAGRSGIA